jgi:hypothetical protein
VGKSCPVLWGPDYLDLEVPVQGEEVVSHLSEREREGLAWVGARLGYARYRGGVRGDEEEVGDRVVSEYKLSG